jgi:hypothetical protein
MGRPEQITTDAWVGVGVRYASAAPGTGHLHGPDLDEKDLDVGGGSE